MQHIEIVVKIMMQATVGACSLVVVGERGTACLYHTRVVVVMLVSGPNECIVFGLDRRDHGKGGRRRRSRSSSSRKGSHPHQQWLLRRVVLPLLLCFG